MQSSFRVIKNNSVFNNGIREIQTEALISREEEDINSNDNKKAEEEAFERIQISYNNLATSVLENARRQSEQIITETYKRAQEIEKEAYERGYENGQKQAYNDTYDRAYEEHVIEAQKEAEGILNQAYEVADYADNLLKNSKIIYENYLNEKKSEIKELVLEITKNILHKEVQAEDSINEMVLFALNQIRNGKTFIVKCNSCYVDELKENVKVWQKQLTFKCDVFVIEDETLDLGNVVIEKDNGHLEVGIDVGFARVKQIIQEND